ncbi:hypothetical protein NOR_01315 [Metarhizium rileyi]|uniref:Uncharacterized protein n=1 Tax=Metarhizium rileyi (strain RCEF 4871) TaxID=1649241 RepID=A0A167ISQ4_METRR|nr:hypothetical protein NOR_01315 [Metarhizium rileyi RCEF 4871]TWU77956.1 hypothetical protein ED733_005684 [Metarhizium rileyi]
MALAIPTSEGPFESITFLRDRMDWPAWLDDVTAISRALNIWLYVNPDGKHDLSEPVKPTIPTPPQLKSLPGREQYETDKVYDLRVEQERCARSLSLREYDVSYEQYRTETAEYRANLAAYTAAKDGLQKLYRIIYRSIPERYRAYLRLGGAETPRDMILCLRSRIQPSSDEERAPIAQRQLDVKLNAQATDDKEDFIEAIALAAVELHRIKASTFDEATAVKDLVNSLQTIDKPFADAWSLKFDGASGGASGTVLDIVEELKYRMRMQDDKPYLKKLSGATPAAAPVPAGTTLGEPELIMFADDEIITPAVHNHTINQNGVEPATPELAKKTKEDAAFAEQQPPPESKKTDWEIPLIEKPIKSKITADSYPTDQLARPKNGAPDSALWRPKKKGESNGYLTMRICPGCQLRHLIRGDAWWESCYVYFELVGLGNVPEHFTVTSKKLDLAYNRLDDFPAENERALEWTKKNRRSSTGVVKELKNTEFNLW